MSPSDQCHTTNDLSRPAIDAGMNARQTKPVIVNCDSNTNQILTLLSGITGGTLQCRERSDFEAFVDKPVTKLPSDRSPGWAAIPLCFIILFESDSALSVH
ncbi:hypothetical protein OCL06_01925 [Alteromonas sp. ASW11-19]|uniref:Uncharacterized protein n=1 Tax=Alteromonas salexigens TaxID=2982530 RepID=A0ABT2VJF0_9ALTE|nr:hypothetical protein [Alteromonas salexigens]MCU7553351.1 hypothetical protein [Alteromonas salexigens]